MKHGVFLKAGTASLILFLSICLIHGTAAGFGVQDRDGRKCAECHTLTTQEAAGLLKGIVKNVHEVGLARTPGLFAASVTGKDGRSGLIYIDFSKSYIISGVTVSLSDRRNISKVEMMNLTRVDTGAIPLEDSLVVGNPEAGKKVFLFTDPQCPFCKKLHPELKKVVQSDPGVVFFIKLMPLVSLHPDSMRISRTIMCEKSVRLLEESFEGKKVADPSCDSDIVDRTIGLARALGIGSTPTLILPDGRMAPGYRPAEEILKLLDTVDVSRGKHAGK
jgi:thiol:disulfide interchange protein DsbC